MRYRLLEILCCPSCSNSLESESFKSKEIKYKSSSHSLVTSNEWDRLYKTDIEDGILICNVCNRVYPIVNYIPRMLPNAFSDYPDFIKKYCEKLQKMFDQKANDYLIKGLRKTKEGFGYEWLTFDGTGSLENTLKFFLLTGIDPCVYQLAYDDILNSKLWVGDLKKTISDINYEPNGSFLENKLVLDAGCGMGRYVEVANKYAKEIIGVDISRAVDRARKRIGDHPFTHFIQGDLMDLPLRKSIFDFIYCIYVIQHTPNPQKTFSHLVKFLKEDCQISLTAYEKSNYQMKDELEKLIRKVTTMLPLKLLHYLSFLGVPLGWLQDNAIKYPILKLLFSPLFIFYVGGHPNWKIRLMDTFDLYVAEYQFRYAKHEVKEWFIREGFSHVEFIPWNNCGAGVVVKGKKRFI